MDGHRARIEQLLQILDQAYNRKSWHGTNLRGSIRGVAAVQAQWRPAPNRHSIHELVVHAAYWKYAVANRLSGGKRGAFPLKGSNFFSRPSDERSWRDDVSLLESIHQELRGCVARLRDRDLDRRLPKSQVTPFTLVAGVAAHDVYHAGQIQLIKTIHRQSSKSGGV